MSKLQTLAPASYRVWRRQATELGELNGWTDDLNAAAVANLTAQEATARERRRKRGVLQLFAALEGEAAHSVAHLDTRSYADINAFLAALDGLALTPAGAQLAEEEFKAARQQPEDSLLQFAARVRNKFTEAFPGENCETSRDAKRQFICSLTSKALSRELARRCPLERTSYTELVREAQHVYAADLMIYNHHPSSKKEPNVNAIGDGSGPSKKGHRNSRGGKQGKKGNASSNRRGADGVLRNQKGDKILCFKCQQNHYRRDCPENKNNGNGNGHSKKKGGATGGQVNDIHADEDDEEDDLAALEEEAFSGN